jgi:hypothetical protein
LILKSNSEVTILVDKFCENISFILELNHKRLSSFEIDLVLFEDIFLRTLILGLSQ